MYVNAIGVVITVAGVGCGIWRTIADDLAFLSGKWQIRASGTIVEVNFLCK